MKPTTALLALAVALGATACNEEAPFFPVTDAAGADGGTTDGGATDGGATDGGDGSSTDGGDPDATTDIDTGSDADDDATPDADDDATPDADNDATPDADNDATPDADNDATPDADSDATPDAGPRVNACLNANDDLELAFGVDDELEAAVGCGVTCGDDNVCAGSCVASETELTADCARCFGTLGSCVVSQCTLDCASGDASDPICADCIDDNCERAFETCSGRDDVLPEGVAPDTCLRARPTSVNFGGQVAGSFTPRTVEIENCATAGGPSFDLERVRIDGIATAPFELVDTPILPTTLAPGRAAAVTVGYRPATAGDSATLTFVTSAGTTSTTLSGQLSASPAPVIAGGCQTTADAVPTSSLSVNLPQAVACTSTGTTGAEEILWSLVRRPTGSDARVLGPTRERAPIVLDRAGTYEVELRATSGDGVSSTARYTISAAAPADSGLVVAMYWDTPAEADPFASGVGVLGADMDIHLRETSLGCWATNPADCYYANLNPDWGLDGVANDPSLERDDTSGLGPEFIAIPTPDTGAIYEVAVQYWDPRRDSTPSTPYFAVYENGVLLDFFDVSPLTVERSWNIAFDLSQEFLAGWRIGRIDRVTTEDPPACP